MGNTKTTLRDRASALADTLAPHVENARDKAAPVLADARDRAVPALTDAAAKAGPALSEAKAKAVPVLMDARDRAIPVLVDARDKAAPVLVMAREKAAPMLSQARSRTAPVRDKAAPVLSDARDRFSTDVLPVFTAAIAAVDSATEDARAQTKKRGRAVAAALKGEAPQPAKKHRVRQLLIALGLGGLAYAITKKMSSRQATTSWQSSYTPPPATATSGDPVADGGLHRADTAEDVAAADPGEAFADASDLPHTPSDPDSPVTRTDLDEPRGTV